MNPLELDDALDQDDSGEMPDGSFVLSVVVAYGQKIKIVIEKVE